MVREQLVRGAQCSVRGAIILALVALPSVALAQSGNGFLFKKPSGSFVMRAGYEPSRANGEGFDQFRRETTLGSNSFDSFNVGFDLNYFLTESFGLTFTLDVASRSNTSEYRDWDESGKPIVHENQLERAGSGGGL